VVERSVAMVSLARAAPGPPARLTLSPYGSYCSAKASVRSGERYRLTVASMTPYGWSVATKISFGLSSPNGVRSTSR